MTYEAFRAKALAGPLVGWECETLCSSPDSGYEIANNDDIQLKRFWVTGGTAGGSCWDTPHYSRDPEPTPEWEVLDALLEAYAPQVTYLQYKRLLKAVSSSSDYRDEYYGNSYHYAIERLPLRAVYDFLVDLGALAGDV